MDKKVLKKAFLGSTAIAAAALIGALGLGGDPEMTDDQKAVDAICASGKPLLIIDYFSNRAPDMGVQHPAHSIDVDGDRIPDIHHGDMAAAIAEASGFDVIRYGLSDGNKIEDNHGHDHHGHGEHGVGVSESDLVAIFSDIISRLEKGELAKPAAISISLDWPAAIEELHKDLGSDLDLTFDNLAEKREMILDRIEKKYGQEGSGNEKLDFYYTMHQKFSALEKLGVPVIVAAGNSHSKTVNVLNILGGVAIGALTKEGKAADFSNKSSLTSIYRLGEFKTYRVEGGVDVNNDGKPEFDTASLSNNIDLIKTFRGSGKWGANISGTSFATPNICGKDAGPGNFFWLHNMLP